MYNLKILIYSNLVFVSCKIYNTVHFKWFKFKRLYLNLKQKVYCYISIIDYFFFIMTKKNDGAVFNIYEKGHLQNDKLNNKKR